jgi:hypothetical protein
MAIEQVFAITGEKGAGKGSAAKLIANLNGSYLIRLSDPIRIYDILKRSGVAIASIEDLSQRLAAFYEQNYSLNADIFGAAIYGRFSLNSPQTSSLQDAGNEIRSRFGAGALVPIIAIACQILGWKRVVFDGIRNPGEIEALKKSFPGKFILIGIVAPYNVRQQRFLEGRMRIGDPKTPADFAKLDERDKGIGEPPEGQQVAKCLALVEPENLIENGGTLDDLEFILKNCLKT